MRITHQLCFPTRPEPKLLPDFVPFRSLEEKNHTIQSAVDDVFRTLVRREGRPTLLTSMLLLQHVGYKLLVKRGNPGSVHATDGRFSGENQLAQELYFPKTGGSAPTQGSSAAKTDLLSTVQRWWCPTCERNWVLTGREFHSHWKLCKGREKN